MCYADKFVTIYNVFLNPIVILNAFCKSCVRISSCLSKLIYSLLYADRIEHFVSCIRLSFVQFALFRKSQKKNLAELGLEIESALSL